MRIIVTGANRGIGLEVVRQLSSLYTAKDDLIIGTARAAADRDEALKALGRPKNVAFGLLDVTSHTSVFDFVRTNVANKPPVDVLINNAGYLAHANELGHASETLSVNLFGVLDLTEALLPHLSKGGARVLNISSSLGILNSEYSSARKQSILRLPTIQDVRSAGIEFLNDVFADRLDASGWRPYAYAVSKALLNRAGVVWAEVYRERSLFVANLAVGHTRTRMGGEGAPISVESTAKSVVWFVTSSKIGSADSILDDSGKYWRNTQEISY